MNNFVTCFDVASMVIEEATKQFAPLWKLNTEKYDILKQYCTVVDELSEEFEGVSYDVEVDDITLTISITLECSDVVIEQSTHKFYEIAQRANSLSFNLSEDNNLNVKFVFPCVWDKI